MFLVGYEAVCRAQVLLKWSGLLGALSFVVLMLSPLLMRLGKLEKPGGGT
jgi:hypothetical protein